jgi:hypothetical protein
MLYRPLILLILLSACSQRTENQFDIKAETGLSEEELYLFLNETYANKLDTINGGRIIYEYAGRPIKIEFHNGTPTELEPPTMDYLEASYKLDHNRLEDFKLVSPEVYSHARKLMQDGDCRYFDKQIGVHMFFVYLPWYNPKDSTLLFKDVYNVCPSLYHQGQGVIYRFKKNRDEWVLIN